MLDPPKSTSMFHKFLVKCVVIMSLLKGKICGKSYWIKVIFYFLLDFNLFFVLSIKENYFFSIIIQYLIHFYFSVVGAILSIFYYQFYFFIEHIFHKITLNIYFDHIHIMCLYRVFFVHYTGYMLVYIKVEISNFKA